MAAQSLAKEVLRATISRGDLNIVIDADGATVNDALATVNDALTTVSSTAITLSAMYTGYKIAAKILDVVNIALSGRKDGQEVQNVQPSTGLHVLLHCSNERFLEVFGDFKSGRMKKRLELEFSFANIKTEGLVVKIENIEEVEERIAVINGQKQK